MPYPADRWPRKQYHSERGPAFAIIGKLGLNAGREITILKPVRAADELKE